MNKIPTWPGVFLVQYTSKDGDMCQGVVIVAKGPDSLVASQVAWMDKEGYPIPRKVPGDFTNLDIWKNITWYQMSLPPTG